MYYILAPKARFIGFLRYVILFIPGFESGISQFARLNQLNKLKLNVSAGDTLFTVIEGLCSAS